MAGNLVTLLIANNNGPRRDLRGNALVGPPPKRSAVSASLPANIRRSFFARQYQTIGMLTSTKVSLGLGYVQFLTEQSTADELTNITHQISYDGVHFSSITPESQFDLGGNPFWYRVLLERLDSNFNLKSTPVPTPGQDPEAADYYKVGNMSRSTLATTSSNGRSIWTFSLRPSIPAAGRSFSGKSLCRGRCRCTRVRRSWDRKNTSSPTTR
jgi:hypothetical protein